MLGQIKGSIIDPQRPAQPPSRRIQQLTEPRDQGQTAFDHMTHSLDPEATVRIEQPCAIEDGEGADVLGPAEFIRPQQHEILRGQPLHDCHPGARLGCQTFGGGCPGWDEHSAGFVQ